MDAGLGRPASSADGADGFAARSSLLKDSLPELLPLLMTLATFPGHFSPLGIDGVILPGLARCGSPDDYHWDSLKGLEVGWCPWSIASIQIPRLFRGLRQRRLFGAQAITGLEFWR